MKICVICTLYPPLASGGAARVAQLTAEGLVVRGHEVLVISTGPKRREGIEEIGGVKVYRIRPLNIYPKYEAQNQPEILKPIWHTIDLWNPHSYFAVKNILEKESPDVVHLHNFKSLSLSVFGAVKSLNLPLIFTAHDFSLICIRANLLKGSGNICDSPSRLCKVYVGIQKFIVDSKPDLVTAPSQFAIDKLKANGLFKDVKMLKLPNAIELKDEEVEKKYKTIDIMYAGELGRHKGVQILIKAFKELESENAILHILGNGRDEAEFREIAGSDERIVFHGFKVGKELIDIYKKANIMVVPSLCYDNSPMVICEAFRSGIPVVGSNIGGIPELIEDGYNGFLFEAGDVKGLKGILKNLIKDPTRLEELSKNAQSSVEKYGMQDHLKRLEEAYRRELYA
ncbi:MAG: glycosyltransferase family 4 protein [Halobacteriota archaeon]|nr:glycosyltransferase family 4 protein [Halobacteriota archaeon]